MLSQVWIFPPDPQVLKFPLGPGLSCIGWYLSAPGAGWRTVLCFVFLSTPLQRLGLAMDHWSVEVLSSEACGVPRSPSLALPSFLFCLFPCRVRGQQTGNAGDSTDKSNMLNNKSRTFFSHCIYFVCGVYTYLPGGQRTTCENLFSPSPMGSQGSGSGCQPCGQAPLPTAQLTNPQVCLRTLGCS